MGTTLTHEIFMRTIDIYDKLVILSIQIYSQYNSRWKYFVSSSCAPEQGVISHSQTSLILIEWVMVQYWSWILHVFLERVHSNVIFAHRRGPGWWHRAGIGIGWIRIRNTSCCVIIFKTACQNHESRQEAAPCEVVKIAQWCTWALLNRVQERLSWFGTGDREKWNKQSDAPEK